MPRAGAVGEATTMRRPLLTATRESQQRAMKTQHSQGKAVVYAGCFLTVSEGMRGFAPLFAFAYRHQNGKTTEDGGPRPEILERRCGGQKTPSPSRQNVHVPGEGENQSLDREHWLRVTR